MPEADEELSTYSKVSLSAFICKRGKSMKNEYSLLQSLAVQTTIAHIQLVKTNHIIQQTVREAGAYILDITPF